MIVHLCSAINAAKFRVLKFPKFSKHYPCQTPSNAGRDTFRTHYSCKVAARRDLARNGNPEAWETSWAASTRRVSRARSCGDARPTASRVMGQPSARWQCRKQRNTRTRPVSVLAWEGSAVLNFACSADEHARSRFRRLLRK